MKLPKKERPAMKKGRLLAVLLAVCLLIPSFTALADQSGTLYTAGTKLVSAAGLEGDVVVPDGITQITSGAIDANTGVPYPAPFADNPKITSITLPDSVTELAAGTFRNCTGLTRMVLPAGITELPVSLFSGCTALEEVVIPSGVTAIGDCAFLGCSSLKRIVLPAGITKLPQALFSGCTALEEVVIPDGVTAIDTGVFLRCTALKRVVLPAGIEELPQALFEDCTALERLVIPEHVREVPDRLCKGCTALREVVFPAGVEMICNEAFRGCTSLKKVTLPKELYLFDWAFRDCTSLEEVEGPERFKGELGSSIFDNTPWMDRQTGLVILGDTLLTYRGSEREVIVPAGVRHIGCRAFESNWMVERIVLPEGLEQIDFYAFIGCISLRELNIPNTVTKIGENAFADTLWASAQGEFMIQDGVLLNYAGTDLQVTVPDGVTALGEGVFSHHPDIQSVTLPNSLRVIERGAFSGNDAMKHITIPPWVTTIRQNAFASCTALTEVEMPASLTTLEWGAFNSCRSLTKLTIPYGVSELPDNLFAGCRSLTELTIPGTVSKVGSGVITFYLEVLHTSPGNPAAEEAKIYFTQEENGDRKPAITIIYDQPPASGTAYPSTQMVELNGRPVEFQMYALKDLNGNDTNYVKVRDVAYYLDNTSARFNVGWSGQVNVETGVPYTDRNGQENSTPYHDPRHYDLCTAPTLVNGVPTSVEAFILLDDAGKGSTYYKLRDLGRVLGFQVDWTAERGVFLETEG